MTIDKYINVNYSKIAMLVNKTHTHYWHFRVLHTSIDALKFKTNSKYFIALWNAVMLYSQVLILFSWFNFMRTLISIRFIRNNGFCSTLTLYPNRYNMIDFTKNTL